MAEPTPTTLLPPIIDLGRALAAISIEYNRIDERAGTRIATTADGDAMRLLFTQEETLWRIISTLPARSLADAAVQIGVACHYAGGIECNDWSGAEGQRALAEDGKALWRICLRVLPLVAAAAGLDMAAMDWTQNEDLRAGQFYGVEASS